ncbi:MAG: TyeA family type III secretion system gatekeeper subunit [Verrucomicrobia bacterium]|nr:MAG: TyeA family type III secretion system gatekeeper subunit [Verrucomicrobiota bacterium]
MTEFASEETFKIPEGSQLARADILIRELLRMLKEESASATDFEQLADRLQIPPHSQARIYFFTQLYQQVHEFPLRLFKSPQRREELLFTIQDALDSAIIAEE